MLRLDRDLEVAQPERLVSAHYGQVVARHAGPDCAGVREVLQRAEGRFASWPVDRPSGSRDAVQSGVVHECLYSAPSIVGTCTCLTTIVAEVIPKDL